MTIDDKIRNEKLEYEINREAAKIYIYHQVKLINMNISQVKNATCWSKKGDRTSKAYIFSLRKSFIKQATIEDQRKNQIKAIEDHGKQLVESNELIKKEFNTDRDSVPHEEQKKIFN